MAEFAEPAEIESNHTFDNVHILLVGTKTVLMFTPKVAPFQKGVTSCLQKKVLQVPPDDQGLKWPNATLTFICHHFLNKGQTH